MVVVIHDECGRGSKDKNADLFSVTGLYTYLLFLFLFFIHLCFAAAAGRVWRSKRKKKKELKHTSGHILLQCGAISFQQAAADIKITRCARCFVALLAASSSRRSAGCSAVSFWRDDFTLAFNWFRDSCRPRQQIYSNRIDLCTSASQHTSQPLFKVRRIPLPPAWNQEN